MDKIAENLNEIIDIFGFGCEFGIDDLIIHFSDAENMIEGLLKHGLVEKNPLSGKYYLSDIFTCNAFLSKYLGEEKEEEAERVKREYTCTIKKSELSEFITSIEGFESHIEKITVTSNDDAFDIVIKMNLKKNLISKFVRILSDWRRDF